VVKKLKVHVIKRYCTIKAMRVHVRILGGEERTVEIEGNRVADVLKALQLRAGDYVVTRGGRILPEDAEVREGDTLVIVPVVSGG